MKSRSSFILPYVQGHVWVDNIPTFRRTDPVFLMDDDSGKAYVVEVKRSLAKSLKKDEKIKLYTKVASVIPLANYEVHYLYAGIDDQDIVIVDENNKKFVL